MTKCSKKVSMKWTSLLAQGWTKIPGAQQMLYWDKNGFTLLYKRLEKEKFKIPNLLSVRSITHDQLRWLFDGLDIDKITGFKSLKYTAFY